MPTNEITFKHTNGHFTHVTLFIDLKRCELLAHFFTNDNKTTGLFESWNLLEHPELVELYDPHRAAWDLESVICLLTQVEMEPVGV